MELLDNIAKQDEIRREMAELEAHEAASFQRGSQAGKSLYTRKLEKQRACPSRLTARTALCVGQTMNPTLALVALLLFTLTAMRR